MRKIKAAVVYEYRAPLKVEEVELDDEPKAGEVLVKVLASGLCHSDIHPWKGDMPIKLPCVLGHEGAGIVEAVGEGVTMVKPGDHVVMSVVSYCGKCPHCVSGKPYICSVTPMTFFSGLLPDGTTRLKTKDGRDIRHWFSQASFAEYIIVAERQAVKVRDDAPLDTVCLLSCGASTGIGAVLNAAEVKAGESVAVFGCGGVGLCIIMAAKLVGANPIIAVDVFDNKLEMAKQLGATHLINSTKINLKDLSRWVVELGGIAPRGVDYTFDAVGNTNLQILSVALLAQGGTAVLVGGADPAGADPFTFNALAPHMIPGRTIKGTSSGNIIPSIDIPRYVDLFMDGRIPLDKLVTRKYPLEQINEAIKAVLDGQVMRCVIIP